MLFMAERIAEGESEEEEDSMIDRNGRPERPIITFQCRVERGRGSSKHAVVAHWTRLSQNCSGGREGGPTDSAETTAVMKQTSSWRTVCRNKAEVKFPKKLPELRDL